MRYGVYFTASFKKLNTFRCMTSTMHSIFQWDCSWWSLIFLTINSPAFCWRLFLKEHLSITFVKVALNVIYEVNSFLILFQRIWSAIYSFARQMFIFIYIIYNYIFYIFKTENVFSCFKVVFGLPILLMRIRFSYMLFCSSQRALLTWSY